MHHPAEVFQYNTLQQDAREIRLLHIEPSTDSTRASIECVVETATLADNPEYTALSYAWGDQSVRLPILVNGKTIEVPENLHGALKKLRVSFVGVLLWIDAICINQQDDIEKSWQVELMLTIYRKAERTLVWLGPTADDSDSLFEGFNDLGADVLAVGLNELDGEALVDAGKVIFDAVSPFNRFKSPQGQPGTFEDIIFKRFYGEGRRDLKLIFPPTAIKAFLDRAWWKRIWVLQEFSVSRSVIFMCGDMAASAPVIDAALTLVQLWNDAVLQMDSAIFTMERVHEGTLVGLENYIEDTKSSWTPIYDTEKHHKLLFQQRRFYQRKEQISLLNLLEFSAGAETGAPLQASDPRDILFALLGLSSDAKELGITADYTKSIREVYEEAAIAFVKGRWHVILSSTNIDLEAVKRKEWASWIPDWRKKFSVPQARYRGAVHDISAKFNAGRGLGVQNTTLYVLEKPPLLEMACSVLDLVVQDKVLPLSRIINKTDKPTLPLHDVSPDFIKSVKEAELFAKDEKHTLGYITDLQDTIWRTLTADLVILALQRRTVACRTTRKAQRTYRAAFRAIIENRLQEYVMREQREAMEKFLHEQEDSSSRQKGLANPIALPTTAAGVLSEFAFTVTNMLAGRALLKTKQGLLCLGPMEAREGDLIVIGHGMPTPIVIRPTGRQVRSQIWGAYLGDVYVHGVMDGEASKLHLPRRIVNIH